MSVHLKEGVVPLAKRGKPGNFQLVQLAEEKMSYLNLNELANEILDSAKMSNQGSVEISRKGADYCTARNISNCHHKAAIFRGY